MTELYFKFVEGPNIIAHTVGGESVDQAYKLIAEFMRAKPGRILLAKSVRQVVLVPVDPDRLPQSFSDFLFEQTNEALDEP